MVKISLLNKKHLLGLLIVVNLILAALYLLTNHIMTVTSWSLSHWFDLNAEANIPTWISSATLLLLFALSAALSIIYTRQGINKYQARLLMVMATVFLFFSMDETAAFHEAITVWAQTLRAYLPAYVCQVVWVCIYAAVALVLALICARGSREFLKDKTGRKVFILGGIVFVCGGVLIEFAVQIYEEVTGFLPAWVPAADFTVGESLELLGESLMVYGLMTKIEATGVSLKSLLPHQMELTEKKGHQPDEKLVEN